MVRRLTTEEFIEKAKAVHGDRYDYSQVEYGNNRSPVTIICADHGSFLQSPDSHVNKQCGCPDCGGYKKLTTELFAERAKAVHGDRYDYSSVDYVEAHAKVTIICLEHGPFEQKPHNHVFLGQGCNECGGNKPLTSESFIEKAELIHGNRFDYSSVDYVGAHAKVTIICLEHGPFEQTPTSHCSKGRNVGCPDCGGTKPLTNESFIERAKAIHRDRYDYSSVNYVDAKTNVTIICPDHGPFEQTPDTHINANCGCSDCADFGFNPSEPGLLYYVAVTTDDGDTRYKIGITNYSVEKRFRGSDLARIRIVKTWQFAVGRSAAEREAEILIQYSGDKYFGPALLVSGGNTELFTHDILGLDK